MTIDSENIFLVQCNEQILQAAINGDIELSRFLKCKVSQNWSEFGTEIFPYVLDKITRSPEEQDWWTYFPIHKKNNQLIGSGGYKGSPTKDGTVEIGYEIAKEYRNKGFATELAKSLITHAFKQADINIIYAHTLAHENASTRVLLKCGFHKVEELHDPNDGEVWKWELVREDWEDD
jgi:ribosomal-protein-alanine N-acetyltransferase